MTMDFTHASYVKLLAFIRGLGYSVGAFRDVAAADSYVLLRHDIDFSLERALRMAQLDSEAGVTATYFILLTSPFFNALSATGRGQVRSIAALGHEIGLHIDLTGFELLSSEEQRSQVDQLARLLSEVAGSPVTAIAQHRPASTLVRLPHLGYLDAYDDPYFKNIGYISDSRRVFITPDVYEFFRSNTRSQLLTHPIW